MNGYSAIVRRGKINWEELKAGGLSIRHLVRVSVLWFGRENRWWTASLSQADGSLLNSVTNRIISSLLLAALFYRILYWSVFILRSHHSLHSCSGLFLFLKEVVFLSRSVVPKTRPAPLDAQYPRRDSTQWRQWRSRHLLESMERLAGPCPHNNNIIRASINLSRVAWNGACLITRFLGIFSLFHLLSFCENLHGDQIRLNKILKKSWPPKHVCRLHRWRPTLQVDPPSGLRRKRTRGHGGGWKKGNLLDRLNQQTE